MSLQAVQETVEYLRRRQESGCVRWDKDCVVAFSKLLGSGYIRESIRSLWPLYQDSRRHIVAYMLETADAWRRYLRQVPAPDVATNREFARVMQGFIENLEHPAQLPQSPLFAIEDGRVKWTGKMSEMAQSGHALTGADGGD